MSAAQDKRLKSLGSTWFTAALLALFAALVLLRMPGILAGRFWAEEGVVYFANALTQPWYAAWFAVFAGYLNLACGLCTWIASQFGLAAAPRVTVALALLLQCLPAYVLLTHDFPWRGRRLASAAVIILAALPPMMGEVWLNTVTSQFQLSLFAALLLGSRPPSAPALRALDHTALVLAALSGPGAVMLAPLFIARAMRFVRTRDAALQAAILTAGCAIQIAVILLHPGTPRGGSMTVAQVLAAIDLHTIVLCFVGAVPAQQFATWVGGAPHRIVAGVAPIILFYGITGAAAARARSVALAGLLAASALISLVSFSFALHGSFAGGFVQIGEGQRYAFAPAVLNEMVVAGLACVAPGRLRWLFVALTLLLLLVTLINARTGLGLFSSGPDWASQIRQAHAGSLLQVWPGGSWMFRLPSP